MEDVFALEVAIFMAGFCGGVFFMVAVFQKKLYDIIKDREADER